MSDEQRPTGGDTGQRPDESEDQTPTTPQEPVDEVGEASDDSFPASDPPSFTGSTASD